MKKNQAVALVALIALATAPLTAEVVDTSIVARPSISGGLVLFCSMATDAEGSEGHAFVAVGLGTRLDELRVVRALGMTAVEDAEGEAFGEVSAEAVDDVCGAEEAKTLVVQVGAKEYRAALAALEGRLDPEDEQYSPGARALFLGWDMVDVLGIDRGYARRRAQLPPSSAISFFRDLLLVNRQ